MVHGLYITQNSFISRFFFFFAKAGKKIMYQELQCTCTAIVLLIKPFLATFCYRCGRAFLKFGEDHTSNACSWNNCKSDTF